MKLGPDRDWSSSALPETAAEAVNDSDKLFDVTVRTVVGSIHRGGNFTPRVAAFMLIAEQNRDGDYEFPNEDGSMVLVMVDTVNQAKHG